MKKLRITVEGKVYDVTVEVLEDDEQYIPGAQVHPIVAPPAAKTAAVRPAAPARQAGGALPPPDPNTIRAPIAGTVQKVFVAAGGHVEEKAPVVLLDAMKMDTYIYSPRGGEIAEIAVAPGDTVQVGDLLLRLRAED